jgi:hypothetical protein
MSCMKSRNGSGSSAGACNGGNKGGGKAGPGEERKTTVGHDDSCGYCGKKGHWAHECRKKKCDEEAHAHVTVGEEDEQSILPAHDIVIDPSPTLVPAVAAIERRPIDIEEQRVFADLSSTKGNHHDRWVLDTGASKHMMGSKEIFAKLDSQDTGTVKFDDGSITNIEGRGSILLTCKNDAHHTLTRVYYIPRLRASIISVGQLHELGCHIAINEGILRIYNPSGHLLAKVTWDSCRLYHLTLGTPDVHGSATVRGGVVVARTFRPPQPQLTVATCMLEHGSGHAHA